MATFYPNFEVHEEGKHRFEKNSQVGAINLSSCGLRQRPSVGSKAGVFYRCVFSRTCVYIFREDINGRNISEAL